MLWVKSAAGDLWEKYTQVKRLDSDIKETTIKSLKGTMSQGDYGLFVTLSHYTKKGAGISG